MTLLERIVIPVATETDASETADAVEPYLEEVDEVVAVHVIEKAGGGIDKAPLEKRKKDAEEALAVVTARLGERVPVETTVAYGTDVVDALFETATEADASAIVFVPRGGSKIVRLLTGKTSTRLVTEAAVPVVALPGGR